MLTRSTASRAASARISAQETTPGHAASSWDLASSITWKPLSPRLGNAFLSDEGESIRTDASQPWNVRLINLLLHRSKIALLWIWFNYLNKTIMKMEPKQGSSKSGVFVEVLLHGGPHDRLRILDMMKSRSRSLNRPRHTLPPPSSSPPSRLSVDTPFF